MFNGYSSAASWASAGSATNTYRKIQTMASTSAGAEDAICRPIMTVATTTRL